MSNDTFRTAARLIRTGDVITETVHDPEKGNVVREVLVSTVEPGELTTAWGQIPVHYVTGYDLAKDKKVKYTSTAVMRWLITRSPIGYAKPVAPQAVNA
jgi:hypothetical protein